MNKEKKFSILSGVLAIIIVMTMIPFSTVFAAAAVSISISGTAEVGKTITASLTISGPEATYYGFSGGFAYNSNLLTLNSISSNYLSDSEKNVSLGTFACGGKSIPSGSTIVTATFTCIAAGDTTISLQGFEVDNVDSSDSKSVSIKDPVPKSSNSSLSSLTVSPGTLSPAFSKTTFSYSMSVGEDQSKITVSATPEDSKASVSLNGVQKNIKPGTNTVKVTVTAEDGTTSVYSIVVTRESGPTSTPTPTPEPLPLMVYLDEELMILPIDDSTVIPEGFVAAFSTYKGVQIPVVQGKASPTSTEDILLILLVTDTGSKYFVYDPELQIVYPFIFISQGAISLQVLQASEALTIPVGYEAFPFEYQGDTIIAYRLISDPESKQILIYVQNAAGEGVFYYFDTELLMLMPYRGEVQIVVATPTPTIAPTESVTESIPSDTSILPTESVISETKTLGQNLTDLKNPLTILFYLVSLIALVLIAAVVTLLLTRNSAYGEEIENAIDDDEEDYLPEDNYIPPIIVSPDKKDYFQALGSIDEPSSEEVESKSPPKSQAPNYAPAASVPAVKRPVSSDTPVMGVRTINLDSIPGLATPALEPVNTLTAPDTSSASPIPVRLKQELEAEKLSAASKISQVPEKVAPPVQAPQIPSGNLNKPSPYNRVLDFPDLSKNTENRPHNDNSFTDPDME